MVGVFRELTDQSFWRPFLQLFSGIMLCLSCESMNAEKPHIRLVGSPKPVETLADINDDDLMLLAKAGRQDAFKTLVNRYQALVLGLSTRFLGDRVAGRDVAQDVFLALWAERDRYKAHGKFRSFLVSMTLHRCHMVVRKRKTHSEHLQRQVQAKEKLLPSEEDLSIQSVVEYERAMELRKLLAHVPEKQRCVLILRFTLDLTFEEIGAATDLPVGTVKSHVFRGLKRLRTLLVEE